jgi:hypothetical protein
MLLSAWITETIGVHAIFGGFITGIAVPRKNGFNVAIMEKIEDLVTILLLPLVCFPPSPTLVFTQMNILIALLSTRL